MSIGAFFDLVLINPLTNLFVLLTVLVGNPGVAVILLTILLRLVTFPLYLKQMHSTRMMAAAGPMMQEIQKKYKDPRRRSEEQMKLYRELGINPLGCLSSMIIQMPILAALYRTFRIALGSSPEAVVELSHRLYPWGFLRNAVPLKEHFLWMSLGSPDPLFIPITVAISTYVFQKMTMMPPADEKQAAQNSMMNLMMPLIFGWITLTLPSGLGLYYVLSNLIGMVMQYIYVGGGGVNWRALVGLSQQPVLPKALEVRQAQMEAGRRLQEKAAEAESTAQDKREATTSAGSAAAARRRRRYASGRRRGRR